MKRCQNIIVSYFTVRQTPDYMMQTMLTSMQLSANMLVTLTLYKLFFTENTCRLVLIYNQTHKRLAVVELLAIEVFKVINSEYTESIIITNKIECCHKNIKTCPHI